MKILKTILIAVIPALIFFDMVDPVLLGIIGFAYILGLIVEGLATFLLGSAHISDDPEFKEITHDRMVASIEDDPQFFTRSSIEALLHIFALVMIFPLSTLVGSVMVLYTTLFIGNLYFSKKSIDYATIPTDSE